MQIDVSEIKAAGVPIVAAGYGGEFAGVTADVLAGDYNPGRDDADVVPTGPCPARVVRESHHPRRLPRKIVPI